MITGFLSKVPRKDSERPKAVLSGDGRTLNLEVRRLPEAETTRIFVDGPDTFAFGKPVLNTDAMKPGKTSFSFPVRAQVSADRLKGRHVTVTIVDGDRSRELRALVE